MNVQSSPQSASPLGLASARRKKEPQHRDHVTYQVITIAAMLLVLVTVWVF
jgi:hypothetical protein